jgi:hypothetical protein
VGPFLVGRGRPTLADEVPRVKRFARGVERALLWCKGMRFLFHGMLGLSMAAVAAGVVMGAKDRLARIESDESTTGSPSALLHHARVDRVSVEATIAPPVPVSPRFAQEVSATPVLTWRLENGTDGARLELCPTNDFAPETTRRIDVTGDHVQLAAALPAGIWYWHLRGRHRAYMGDRTTPTWMIYVRPGEGATTAQADPVGALGG